MRRRSCLTLPARSPASLRAGLLAGALGGLVASWTMNQFQLLLKTAERVYKGPPADAEKDAERACADPDATLKTARAVSQHVSSHDLTPKEAKWAGPAVHYLVGTALGAVYGVLAESPRPFSLTSAGYGTLYGAGVWLTAECTVPALGLESVKPAPASKARMLAAHLVFGATTYVATTMLLRTIRKRLR
jgi:hypothetical protein